MLPPLCASSGPHTMANSTASYKQLKEDFVSNLSGGYVSEIAQVCAVAPVCDITKPLAPTHC